MRVPTSTVACRHRIAPHDIPFCKHSLRPSSPTHVFAPVRHHRYHAAAVPPPCPRTVRNPPDHPPRHYASRKLRSVTAATAIAGYKSQSIFFNFIATPFFSSDPEGQFAATTPPSPSQPCHQHRLHHPNLFPKLPTPIPAASSPAPYSTIVLPMVRVAQLPRCIPHPNITILGLSFTN